MSLPQTAPTGYALVTCHRCGVTTKRTTKHATWRTTPLPDGGFAFAWDCGRHERKLP